VSDPKDPNPDFSELRRRAEDLLKQEDSAPEDLSAVEALRLIHELRVHQIELEMQNDELRRTQAQLEEARHKYLDLYDFAPVGYLSLDRSGKIIEANLTATGLLGMERSRLLGQYLRMFVGESERRDFQRMLNNLQNLPRRRGEFHLKVSANQLRPMLLNVIFTRDENGEEIHRISLTDITELKEAEGRLQESREKLSRLTRRLLTVQEEERQRIARDLHDEMGQSLMALKMQLNRVKRRFRRGEEDWKEFDEAIDFVTAIAAQARDICQSLRPATLENLGLNGALRQLLEEFKKHHGVEVDEELAEM
jgi:two-component system sensor histidine kinase UhpB